MLLAVFGKNVNVKTGNWLNCFFFASWEMENFPILRSLIKTRMNLMLLLFYRWIFIVSCVNKNDEGKFSCIGLCFGSFAEQ